MNRSHVCGHSGPNLRCSDCGALAGPPPKEAGTGVAFVQNMASACYATVISPQLQALYEEAAAASRECDRLRAEVRRLSLECRNELTMRTAAEREADHWREHCATMQAEVRRSLAETKMAGRPS